MESIVIVDYLFFISLNILWKYLYTTSISIMIVVLDKFLLVFKNFGEVKKGTLFLSFFIDRGTSCKKKRKKEQKNNTSERLTVNAIFKMQLYIINKTIAARRSEVRYEGGTTILSSLFRCLLRRILRQLRRTDRR